MIEKILDSARGKVDAAEVFFSETVTTEISFENGILKNAEKKSIVGAALRVINKGHMGFSSTTDQDRIDEMVENARSSSRFGKKVRFEFPSRVHVTGVNTFDTAVEAYSPVEAIAEGRKAITTLRNTCPKGMTDVSISTSVTSVRIANTSGLDLSYRYTDFSHSITSIIIENDTVLWIGDGGHYGDLTIKTDEYVQKIADLAQKAETRVPRISGTMPVIFTAQELPNLLQSIELGINGKRLLKGDSPLIGCEGKRMLGTITLTDDPFIDHAPGSRPFDDEGVPSQRNILFNDGIFQSFIFDLDTAADTDRASTSNASRGILSSPGIGTTNLVMSPGESNLDEMISSVDEGVIIYGVLGGGQSNLLAGDFALNIMLGFLIHKGEIAGRLIDTMVSGNVYDTFGTISSMSSTVHQIGSLFIPDVMFSELTISGR
ncbi:MAG TPA: TldD/PmbA family protein [Anaerolineae bacterium]|nr:TldD/PmbA family protein [Anaerolineae bacterium]